MSCSERACVLPAGPDGHCGYHREMFSAAGVRLVCTKESIAPQEPNTRQAKHVFYMREWQRKRAAERMAVKRA